MAAAPPQSLRSPRERALAHVAARSAGAPLDPRLRVTLNFHPDRAAAGEQQHAEHDRAEDQDAHADETLGRRRAAGQVVGHRRRVQHAGHDVGPGQHGLHDRRDPGPAAMVSGPVSHGDTAARTAPSMMATLMARAMMIDWTA
jgi:hypothetical protein